jgi:guanylate kinase
MTHGAPARRGVVYVVSGVGGAGKGTLVDRLRAERPELWWSVSWTTRPARRGEVDGVHYHFVSREEFEAEIRRGGFLEWFEVYGHLKGTPKRPILDAIDAGHDVLLELDVDGALAVVQAFGDAARIVFVDAPSEGDQERRLRARGDARADVARRVAMARDERAKARAAGFAILVNDELDRVFERLVAILDGKPDS